MPRYRFRPATADDLPVLNAWKRRPHVAEWWDGPPYGVADLRDPRVAMRVVEADGTPFAFAQDYDVHGWAGHHFGHLPPGSRGMDQFVADPAMIGRGHGAAFVAQRMAAPFARGAPALAVDPHLGNARAIAAYRRAGFAVAGAPRDTEWGLILPMVALRTL